jgi:hypothetical protein
MPFKEIYAVNFANFNLHPHLNLYNWPDMQVLATPATQPPLQSDWAGTTFFITRGPVLNPVPPTSMHSAFVIPPADSLPIESRLLLRATFDKPMAEGFDADGNLHPIPSFGTGPDHGPLGGEFEEPGKSVAIEPDHNTGTNLSASQLTVPEPWAVILNVGVNGDFSTATTVFVSCQFHRRGPTGVRLNTPSGLQIDQSDYLESPLNYKSYQGGLIAPGDDRWIQPPLFSFAHSFSGFGANQDEILHTAGSGFLKLTRIWPPELRDHRIYSTEALTDDSANVIASIGAVGISIITNTGIGQLSVRLRSFSVSINDPLPEP